MIRFVDRDMYMRYTGIGVGHNHTVVADEQSHNSCEKHGGSSSDSDASDVSKSDIADSDRDETSDGLGDSLDEVEGDYDLGPEDGEVDWVDNDDED